MLQDENDDPWIPQLTHTQEILWDVFQTCKKNVVSLAKKSPIYGWCIGDPTHGLHHMDKELVSTRTSDHIEIAISSLAEIVKLKNLKSFYMVKGTGSHEFGQGSATALIANFLETAFDKQIGYVNHALVKHDGLSFDLAHHGPGAGARNWLKGNILRLYTRSIMMDDLQAGREPPDLVVRAHFHNYVPETVKIRTNGHTHRTEAFILPSFSFLDDYARKVAKSPSSVTVGMVVVEVINGKIHEIHDGEDFIQRFDLRKEIDLGI